VQFIHLDPDPYLDCGSRTGSSNSK